MKSPQRIQLAVEDCLTSFCVKNYLFPNYKQVVLKNAFCMKSAQRIQLVVENCLTLFSVKNYPLPKFKDVLLKKAFCKKSAQRILLAVEKCVIIHFVLKTTFCQIISMSCYKMCFV